MEELRGQRSGDAGREVPWWSDWLVIPVAGVVFLIDQLTKRWIRLNLAEGEAIPPRGTFQITHVSNTGSAFGLFPNQTFLLVVASLFGVAILLLIYRHQRISGPLLRLSLGLQLGGAAGNLVDRLTLGYVTDFIKLGWWPVFNLADTSIVLGILLLAWVAYTVPTKRPVRQPPALPPPRAVETPEETPTAVGTQADEDRDLFG